MSFYLITIYLKYARSKKFSSKLFEIRTIIKADTFESAVDQGINRLSQSMSSYFKDETGYNFSDDILDNFDLTSGVEEIEGVPDRKIVEIYDGGTLRDSSTIVGVGESGKDIARRIKQKWQ